MPGVRCDDREGCITMKKRRPRLRGIMKWGGVMLCVLFFALWLASRWYFFGLFPIPRTGAGVAAGGGVCGVGVWTGFLPSDRVFLLTTTQAALAASPGWDWWEFGVNLSEPHAYCPIWVPFTLVLLATGLLFYADRRVTHGLCACCRYDLRGLPPTTTKCPECGNTIALPATSSTP